jgi:AraC family transcriptional regulator of arabinose operon
MYVVTPTPDAVHGRVEAAFGRMLADARWTGTEAPPAPAAGDEPVAVAHGTAARELALCSLEEVVLLTAGTARARRPRPGVDSRIRRAQALITADPAAPHTVRSLAAYVALSPSRFAHLFARQLGQSPMRALREARLRHAARLLERTDLPVERVAAASGFVSPCHFSRVFRERYGAPPGAYRARASMVGA